MPSVEYTEPEADGAPSRPAGGNMPEMICRRLWAILAAAALFGGCGSTKNTPVTAGDLPLVDEAQIVDTQHAVGTTRGGNILYLVAQSDLSDAALKDRELALFRRQGWAIESPRHELAGQRPIEVLHSPSGSILATFRTRSCRNMAAPEPLASRAKKLRDAGSGVLCASVNR